LFDPAQLTGALVMEIRTSQKMSRVEFSRIAGLGGKSTARLNNIERNESWKPGDREAVARVLNKLVPNFDPRYHVEPASAAPGPPYVDVGNGEYAPVEPVVVSLADDDEDDDVLVSQPVTVTVTEPVTAEVTVAPTSFEYAVPDGSYPVSNSELQTWKRCRRKWWLAWYRKLALRTETFVGVRSVGDRIHRALQQWYVPDGQPRVDPRDALERVVVADWTKIAELARERDVEDEQLAGLAREFAKSTNLERAMVEGYVQWLEESGADAELRIIAAETPLTAQVQLDDGRTVTMIGKLDVRVKRVTDDVNLVLDHKTVGDLKGPAVTLPQNEQMLHYMLLEWLNSDDAERRCDGALYNMLKRSQRTSRATPPFYDRVEVRHNPYELAAYRRRMLAASGNILDAIQALDNGGSHFDVVYPSPRGECRFDCDYFAVCNIFDDGSPGLEDMVGALYKEVDPRARYDAKVSDE
jgi:hypothetical protein